MEVFRVSARVKRERAWCGGKWWVAAAVLAAHLGCNPPSNNGPAESEDTAVDLPRWALEREITIGSLDDPAQSLTATENLVVDEDGRIYVGQRMEKEVKVFSPEGELLHTIGRGGEGPGEFSRPGKVGWLGDTLWVSESRFPKVSFFQKDGTFVRSQVVRKDYLEEHFTPSRIDGVLSDGSFLAPTTASGRLVLGGTISEFPYVRLDGEGKVMAKLAMMAMGNSLLRVPVSGGREVALPHPLPTRPLVALSPQADEILLMDRVPSMEDEALRMRLHKITAEGDTVFTRDIPCTALNIPSDYEDSVALPIARKLAETGAPGNTQTFLPAVKEALDLASNSPLALQMTVAAKGEIWVQRNVPGAPEDQWDIYSKDGHPLATLSAPPGTKIHAVEGSLVWATELDELDVPYVVRYRVRR